MINFDDVIGQNTITHNPNWSYIPNHSYRILIIGGSGSAKPNALLNFIHHQPDIDKKYLYAKIPYEAKYQSLINKHESVVFRCYNDPKAFNECSNNMLYNYMLYVVKILINVAQEKSKNY